MRKSETIENGVCEDGNDRQGGTCDGVSLSSREANNPLLSDAKPALQLSTKKLHFVLSFVWSYLGTA